MGIDTAAGRCSDEIEIPPAIREAGVTARMIEAGMNAIPPHSLLGLEEELGMIWIAMDRARLGR